MQTIYRHYHQVLCNTKINSSINTAVDSFFRIKITDFHSFNKMSVLYILLIFGFCSVILADDACIFEHPTHGVVNLISIGLRNGQPRFRDIVPTTASYYSYSYNPCYSFAESSCQNAAVCQSMYKYNILFNLSTFFCLVSSDRLYSFTLATQHMPRWTVDSNNRPVLTYTSGSKSVSITMICSFTGQDGFEVVDENIANHYSMRLLSRCACWNECGSHTPITSTTSSTFFY
jgi:hypothetical protein